MKVILRYFHNPKTGKLVTSVGSLGFALKHKCEVKNVIHWHDATGFWGNCFTIIWALLAIGLLWWLPTSLPIKWGWAAFLILVALPCIVMVLSFYSAITALILGRRLPAFLLGTVAESKPVTASQRACPTMLLSEQKEKPVKKWPALISLVLLLAFMSTRVAIPLRGFAVIVHDIDGSEFSTEEIHRLAPSEYWEYAPRFIRGTAYGMLYFEEDMEKVLVLSMDYILENTKHRSPKPVRDKIQIWLSNITYYFSINIKSGKSVDLSREEMTEEIKEGIESEPVQTALHKAIKNAAGESLEEDFTSLEFAVKWVAIDDYIKKVR